MWSNHSRNPLEIPSRKNWTSFWLGWPANRFVHAGNNNGVEITQADGGILGTIVGVAVISSHFFNHVISGRMSWGFPISSGTATSSPTTIEEGGGYIYGP